MPYPPRRQRKWPGLSVAEARTQHLTKYQFKRGEPQPDNPRGLTTDQRLQYEEARRLQHQAGPLAIRRLVRLAGIDLEANALIPDDELPDPRVVLLAAQNLAERAYGKPREMPETVAAKAEKPKQTRVSISFVAASPSDEPDVGVIDATAPGPSADAAVRTSDGAGLEVTASGAWRKVAHQSAGHKSIPTPQDHPVAPNDWVEFEATRVPAGGGAAQSPPDPASRLSSEQIATLEARVARIREELARLKRRAHDEDDEFSVELQPEKAPLQYEQGTSGRRRSRR